MSFTGNMVGDRDVLGTLLDRLGLPINLISPLRAHAHAVAQSAERLGLVSSGDQESVVIRHTADSLLFALARPPIPGEAWLDVGSGAGFPGLVLACCYPLTHFTLVESNGRKAGFLEVQISDLGLNNAAVQARRVEEIDVKFDVAVARALKHPREALLSLMSRLRPGGLAIVAVGPHERLPEGAEEVRLEDLGDVDSAGVLFKMSAAG